MGRIQKQIYTSEKTILKFNEFLAVTATVDDAGVAAVDGKKIVKAGTIVGGKAKSILEDPAQLVEDKNTVAKGAKADGVLLHDVDVTNGPRETAVILEGYIDLNKIPKAPVAEVVLPKITFMK